MIKVTIKDVAKEAGVATSTVSRVLSNNPKISDETKERVNEAIKKLNYKPNAIARSLANNKTRILGVVVPSEADDLLMNPFFINAMKGMSVYAQSKSYYITYAFSKDENSELDIMKEITNANLIEGVILLRVKEDDKSIKYLKNINFPESLKEIQRLAFADTAIESLTRYKKILKPYFNKFGYEFVTLYKNKKAIKKAVHRLVAETFIPNLENKREVNHISGVKTDNPAA